MQVEIWLVNLPNVFNLSDSLIPRGMRQAKNKYVICFLEIIISLQTFHWGTARIFEQKQLLSFKQLSILTRTMTWIQMQMSLLGQVWLWRKPVLLNEYYPSSCFRFLTEDSKVLGAIFGEAVHFHLLTCHDDYTKSLLELEDKYLQPIQLHNEEFQALNTN